MSWIKHPTILQGKNVDLLPLEEKHFLDLLEIGKQEKIWEFYSVNYGSPDTMLTQLKSSLLKRATDEQYVFVVFHKRDNRIVGCTSFLNIFPQYRKLEIGWTWYSPEYWNTGLNTECKYLLMKYCFETLKTIRVQWQTSYHNIRSRKAIEKIGAKFEGILRNERINENGTYRSSAMYSVIESEWPDVKVNLEKKLTL